MIRRIVIYIISIIMIFSLCALPSLATEELPENLAVSNGNHSVDAAKPYFGKDSIIENVQAALLYETNSDTLLYEWNADAPQHPASLVKILTALLVFENCNLEDTVTVKQSALDAISSDAVSLKLTAGEQLTVETLLYAMIVYSANDAAAVLAEHTSGTMSEFVSLMNSRAAELGCTGSTFMNPHGLHHDQQITTARDMCRILLTALEYPIFREMFGTAFYTVPATNFSDERNLMTNNYFMNSEEVHIYRDERVTGGRAGVTNEGFRAIASLSESGSMEVICIVMGCASEIADNGYSVEVYGGFPETIALMNHAYTNQALVQFVCADQILKQVPVTNGDSDVFYTTKTSFSAVLPSDVNKDNLSFQYQEVPGSTQAPIVKGQNLATLEVWYGETCIAQTDVYAANDVAVAVSKSGTYIKAGNAGAIIVVVIILLVLLAAVAVVVFLLYVRSGKRLVKKPKVKKGRG